MDRERLRLKRENETEDERQARLEKKRAYQKTAAGKRAKKRKMPSGMRERRRP